MSRTVVPLWRFRPISTPWQVAWRLKRALRGCDEVLEIGCGEHSHLCCLPEKVWTVGVDSRLTARMNAEFHHTHDVISQCDGLEFLGGCSDGNYDAVVSCDVVEHLARADSARLVSEMERVARRKVVIVTPPRWHDNGTFAEDDPLGHRCFWTPDEFRARGYTVRGLKGPPWLRSGTAGKVRGFAPLTLAFGLLADLTWLRNRPELAWTMWAEKTL
jgi:hypothetical protein